MKNSILQYQADNKKIPCPAEKIYYSNKGSQAADGTGWLPINLSNYNINTLPKDPLNNDKYFYTYSCDINKNFFEFNAVLESEKYSDAAKNDGGDNPDVYEVSSNSNPQILDFLKTSDSSIDAVSKKIPPSFVSIVPAEECRVGGSSNGVSFWSYNVRSLQGEILFSSGSFQSQSECLYVRSLLEKAAKSKSAVPCQEATNSEWNNTCVEHTAIILGDISICDQSLQKDQCYSVYKFMKE